MTSRTVERPPAALRASWVRLDAPGGIAVKLLMQKNPFLRADLNGDLRAGGPFTLRQISCSLTFTALAAASYVVGKSIFKCEKISEQQALSPNSHSKVYATSATKVS